MNQRQKELIQELENELKQFEYEDIRVPEALDISPDRIRQRVNSSLDAVPQERTRYIRQKRLKAVIILAAAVILTTTTVWAASNIEFLKLFFTGDFSSMEQHVQTPHTSVSDGRFRVTLEQTLAFQTRVVFIYSIEGLTEEATEELMDRSFDGGAMVRLPENSGIRIAMMTQEEMKDLRTQTKKYYSYWLDGFDNPELLPISFSLNMMPDELLEIRMDETVEILEVTLSAPSKDDTVIRLSPMDIFVEKTVSEGYEKLFQYMDIFFRMEDDSIKTFVQLFHGKSGSNARLYETDKPLRMKSTALARDIVDISRIKSIIVGDLEYDLDDPTEPSKVVIDESLKPFYLDRIPHPDPYFKGLMMIVPVEEVIGKLGGELILDQSGENAVVRYRDTTLEIRDGSYYKNGVPIEIDWYQKPVTVDEKLMVDKGIFEESFNVEISTAQRYYPNIAPEDWPESEWYVIP